MKCIAVTNNPANGFRAMEMAPDSAVIYRGNPWFMPADGDSAQWSAQIYIGAVISRLGMNISPKFAQRYFQNITIAAHPHNPSADVSLEWLRDGSVIKGDDITIDSLPENIAVVADNGQCCSIIKQQIIDSLISAICKASAFVTLKTGDIILIKADMADFAIAEGADFQILVNNTPTLKFKTR